MTLYRATVMDVPGDPFADDPAKSLAVESDGALLVRDGIITGRGSYAGLRREHPDEELVDLRGGVLLPGFVDTHVHYPQVRVIGGLGMPLLDWLDRCALPEEIRLADRSYAEAVAGEFLSGLVSSGTTTALVFGSHFAAAVDALFTAAAQTGLRITAGQVLSDRVLPPALLTTPEQGLSEGLALIARWHGHGSLRYVVTPRFSLSASEPLLEVCEELLRTPGTRFTTHINENGAEIDQVASYFPARAHYLDTYSHHRLITDRGVLAHNVHATDHELEVMAAEHCWAAHCPTSNAALGSGLFPLRRHVEAGVGVALGSDVGAGTGFCLLKEGLQAYFAQQLLGPVGYPLSPAHLLYLATRAGAQALGLAGQVGDLGVGKQFDATWLRPQPGSTLDVVLGHAEDAGDALAKIFALGTSADVAGVWVDGHQRYHSTTGSTPSPYSRPQEAA
ncbi:MAG: guanine deaminase [Actinomycetes bacterium]